MVQSVAMGGERFTAKRIDFEKKLAGCKVKSPAWGRYTRVLFEKNPMHDSAWDKMINSSESGKQRKRVFSYVPGLFWAYKLKDTARSGAPWKRVLLKDEVWGRAASSRKVAVGSSGCSGCGCGSTSYKTEKYAAIAGQTKAFASVTLATSIHDGFKALFTLAGEKPEEQFKGMERLVAGNDAKQLAALKSLAMITDPGALEIKIMEIRKNAYAYGKADGVKGEEGLADGAALLAAAAMRQVAKLRDQSSKKCKDLKYTPAAQAALWSKRANAWLKIARRLAHGQDALHYVKYGMEAAADPIFKEKQSSFACTDPKVQAMMMFSAGGDALTISGPVKAFLASSYEAAFGCTGKDRPGPVVVDDKCRRGYKKIKINGKKVCRPKNCPLGRYSNGHCKNEIRTNPNI